MTALTREAIERVLGPVDEHTAAQVVGTGATEEELREAQAWVSNDEPLVDAYRPFPQGRTAEVAEFLRMAQEPDPDR